MSDTGDAGRTIAVGPFRREDQVAVRRLILEGLEDHWGMVDPGLNADLDDIATSYAAGAVFVVRDARRILGVGAIVPRAAEVGELVRVSVDRTARRQGVGAALVGELVAEARRRTWRRLVLETTADWHDAVAFWTAQGFALTHYEEGAFGRDAHFGMDLRPGATSA